MNPSSTPLVFFFLCFLLACPPSGLYCIIHKRGWLTGGSVSDDQSRLYIDHNYRLKKAVENRGDLPQKKMAPQIEACPGNYKSLFTHGLGTAGIQPS